MAQATALIATLKKQLKAHGKTYVDVASALDLSEASVKRLFAGENLTLQRLETVCQLIGLDLAELVALMKQEQPQLMQLTLQQEKEVAEDFILLMVALSVINGYTYEELLETYKLSATDCVRKLAHLDRLKIIELLPNNRIKLKVAPNFRWRSNGPIQKFFHTTVQQEFFRSSFDAEDEKLLVLNGLLSRAGNAEMQKKMQKLAQDFNQVMQDDRALPMGEKFGTTMVLALRHWNFDHFKGNMR
ncbi:helix-turn-helix transcriptional regulator [Pseudomaricurvus alkylphenolicus]|jgi:transcriptional regulator with XRE-family HTH domain|uniref:helix-turn-helix domain-containing protein n=1 Tax=Pseudomaricurvus alkylphenolicus TaxID=1306991 RepID=UPI0014210F9B|nr:helix-turn-helix transcriptional regulator [Pseudomaricurvus alkylphenolicus]NIB39063.1 helix-turn-helix transcriptional regulator [Pseudomaricurvus alkylphenolicus]